jgi:hypothetical protein
MNRRILSQEAEVKIWNLANPVGTPILYTDDFGRQTATTTRSEASVLSGHTAVIWITGKSGCVALERCAVAGTATADTPATPSSGRG